MAEGSNVEIKGFAELVRKLHELELRSKAEGDPAVAVGFHAAYALYVHENMEIWPPGMRLRGLPRGSGFYRDKDGIVRVSQRVLTTGKIGGKNRGFYWDPQGKAGPKFLEGPAREFRAILAQIIMEALMKGQTLSQGLMKAGLRLLREAMQRVPVDTGNLKASGFVIMENTGATVNEATAEGV